MGRYASKLFELRTKSRRQGCRVKRRPPFLLLPDGTEVLLFRTRFTDLVLIRHRWSGRVFATWCLPCRTLDDLDRGTLEGMVMGFLSRPAAPTAASSGGVAFPSDVRADWPALGEYLFLERYPDGSKRARATFTVMAGDASGWKVVLNDRQESRSLWATGESLAEAMLALEAMLQTAEPPWRVDRNYKANGKK